MTLKQRPASSTIQAQILEQLTEVKGKVDESLDLSRQNGEGIRLLRMELGVDGQHGRIPQLEAAVARIDRAQELDNKEAKRRLDVLEAGDHQEQGRKQLWAIVRSFIGGGAGAAAIGVLAKMLGLIH